MPAKFKDQTTNQSSASLPKRWKRNRRRAAMVSLAIVILIAGLLLAGLLHLGNAASNAEDHWLSIRFSLRELISGSEPDNRIALVEIDDKSLEQWSNDPLIAWGGHLADAIDQLNRSGARLIALDWTQPIETDARMNWNHDARLGQALSRCKAVVFVKFIKSDGTYVLPTPSLLLSVPGAVFDNGESALGYAEVGVPNGMWTYVQPVIKDQKKQEVSFAGRIAVKAGFYRSIKELPSHEMLINFGSYAGRPLAPFERASLFDVASAKTPDARWKDKIVFIGATYKGSNDFYPVPFLDRDEMSFKTREIPGVEVHAHAVKTLLDRNEIRQALPVMQWLCASLMGALGVLVFSLWNWGRAAAAAFGIALLWGLLSFLLFIMANFALPLSLPILMLLCGSLLMGGYRALSEERERGQVMRIWGRHQDPRLIGELLAHPEWRGGHGREMTVTVLFADLKNFTKTVEMLPPEKAIESLNRYLSVIVQNVRRHGGVRDKYLGDGLMAQWGAPLQHADHADKAVKACLDIEKQLRELTAQLKAQGDVWFDARLTLHSGPVLFGLVGSDDSLEYTSIGDTVNVTSRLQETAKALSCDFLISETTCELLDETIKQQIVFGRTDEVEIRGRQQPLQVFEVLAGTTDGINDERGTEKES